MYERASYMNNVSSGHRIQVSLPCAWMRLLGEHTVMEMGLTTTDALSSENTYGLRVAIQLSG